MAVTDFLDRTEGMKAIAEFFADAGVGPRVLSVTGVRGCGKSALLRQAGARQRNWSIVEVSRAKPPDGSPCSTSLIVALAAGIERRAIEDGFPARGTGIEDARRLMASGAEIAFGVAAKVSKVFAAAKELRDNLPSLSSFRQADRDSIYVQDSLRQRALALHVDHADDCEPEDWPILAALLSNTGCLLLLEGGVSFVVPSVIPAWLVQQLSLAPLDASFATALFDSLPGGFGDMLKADFQTSGNLKPFEELASRRQMLAPRPGLINGFSETLLGFSKAAFQGLPNTDSQALIAISAHAGGPVGLGLLRRFLGSILAVPSLTTDVLALVRRLENSVLIIRSSAGVQVPGIVLDLVERDRQLALVRLVFQQKWRDFYMDPVRCGMAIPDQRRCLQALRQCVVLKDTVGIAATLEAVNGAHDEAGSRADTVGFTRWLVSQFDLKTEPSIAVAAARHLYSAGWFAEARDVLLAAGKLQQRRDRFLLAELLCSAGPQERGLRTALRERAILSETIDPDAELCIELVIIHGLRNSNQFAEARTRYNMAILQQRFRTCAAYTVLLRFADLCLMRDEDLDTCCRLLEQSADLALERQETHEAVSAYVSLCQQFGYHDLDAAERSLERAEELAQHEWIQLPAILNNRAVLTLYRGVVEEAGLRLLEDALILCSDPLEEILIRTNILIHRSLAGDTSGAGTTELAVCVQENAFDTEIRKIAFYNLERLCNTSGDAAVAATYGKAWRSLESGMDQAYWRFRMTGTDRGGVPAWRLALPFYPVYLSHWKLGTIPFDAVSDER